MKLITIIFLLDFVLIYSCLPTFDAEAAVRDFFYVRDIHAHFIIISNGLYAISFIGKEKNEEDEICTL
jgi:hypothetical protein